jgi:hypothetical protein
MQTKRRDTIPPMPPIPMHGVDDDISDAPWFNARPPKRAPKASPKGDGCLLNVIGIGLLVVGLAYGAYLLAFTMIGAAG